MENFRDFEVQDPFGRTWRALFKYLQTAISIRHSDSVDVRFVLESGDEHIQKTIVLPNPDLRAYTALAGRPLNDSWCSRLAMSKLRQSIETAEDLDKDYIVVSAREIEEFDREIRKWEEEWVRRHAA